MGAFAAMSFGTLFALGATACVIGFFLGAAVAHKAHKFFAKHK